MFNYKVFIHKGRLLFSVTVAVKNAHLARIEAMKFNMAAPMGGLLLYFTDDRSEYKMVKFQISLFREHIFRDSVITLSLCMLSNPNET